MVRSLRVSPSVGWHRLISLLLLGGIALGSAAASTGAQAAPLDACTAQKECRGQLDAAEHAFAQQKYGDALAGYKAAHASVPAPGLLLRIGRCQQLLGNGDEARATYRTLRSTQTLDDETRQTLSTYTAELDAQSGNNTLIVSPHREANPRPIYKTWWFWTGTGVALGGVVAALAIGLAPRAQAEITWAP